jgi:hypothetical protein
MRPESDIHKLIKKLQIKSSVELDRRVHDDITGILAESEKMNSTQPNIYRIIIRSGVMKLTVAAAILIAFGIGFSIGRWTKPTQLTPHSLDITDYIPAVAVHPIPLKTEDSFWRRKALAAIQPRPYIQTQTTKTMLLNAYKQYLKEKDHD